MAKPYPDMLDDIQKAVDEERYELTAWEDNFIVNVGPLIEEGLDLSFDQEAALERIWEKLPPF